MNIEQKVAVLYGIVGTVVSFMFDWVGVAVSILILFMTVDYITGLIAAGINKELSSRIGLAGLGRKVYVLMLVGVVYALEFLAGQYIDLEILGGHIGDGAAFAYIAIEFISITENGVKMGAPIPRFIQDLLKIVSDKADKGSGVK